MLWAWGAVEVRGGRDLGNDVAPPPAVEDRVPVQILGGVRDPAQITATAEGVLMRGMTTGSNDPGAQSAEP